MAKNISDDPYGNGAAAMYDTHHRATARNRLTTRRELACLKKALDVAGSDITVLDLPCGAGRFWPAFANAGVREVIAADISQGMLEVARHNCISEQIPAKLLRSSVFDIDLQDDAVDFIACMRFMHHLALSEDRAKVLSELHRVTRRFVAISLWVDGNVGAWRRSHRPRTKPTQGFGRRVCRTRAEVEWEFRNAGFDVVGWYDTWPKLAMWRTYLLSS